MRLKSALGVLALGAITAVVALEGWQQFRQGDASAERTAARESHRPSIPAAPPPAQLAAPFPYRYAGHMDLGDGKRRVYLSKPRTDLVLIGVGDVLDGVFKVTAIAAHELEVIHVPSAISTRVPFSPLAADAPASGAAGQGAAQANVSAPMASGVDGSIAPASDGLGAGNSTSPFSGAPLETASATLPRPLQDAGAADIAAGTVPTGRLGTPGPAAGAAPLGVEPTGSGSMPNLPAPVGVMNSSPPPTGKLGE